MKKFVALAMVAAVIILAFVALHGADQKPVYTPEVSSEVFHFSDGTLVKIEEDRLLVQYKDGREGEHTLPEGAHFAVGCKDYILFECNEGMYILNLHLLEGRLETGATKFVRVDDVTLKPIVEGKDGIGHFFTWEEGLHD